MPNKANKNIVKNIYLMLINISKNTLSFQRFENYFNYLKNLIESGEDYYLVNTTESLINAKISPNITHNELEKYSEYVEYLSDYIKENKISEENFKDDKESYDYSEDNKVRIK